MTFRKLNKPIDVLSDLQFFINERAKWENSDQKQFVQSQVPQWIVNKSPMLTYLHGLPSFEQSSIIMVEPWTFCHWHQDRSRNSSINCIVQGGEGSNTFMLPQGRRRGQSKLSEIIYGGLGNLVALNVQTFHSVVNRDQPRYALTIGFTCDYPELISILEQQGWVD